MIFDFCSFSAFSRGWTHSNRSLFGGFHSLMRLAKQALKGGFVENGHPELARFVYFAPSILPCHRSWSSY
jgi:hypothetical protein